MPPAATAAGQTPSIEASPGMSATRRPSTIAPRPGRDTAFTLLELMVVVAIVVLLMGLAVPVLVGVFRTVNVSLCAHDLRAASNALHFYGDQYKRFPPASDVVVVDGAYYERSSHDFLTTYMGYDQQLMKLPLQRPSSLARHRPEAFTCPAADREQEGFHFSLAPGIFYQPTPQITDVAGHDRIPSRDYVADSLLIYMADGTPEAPYMLALGDGMFHGLNIERHGLGTGPSRLVGANYLFADGHVQFSETFHLLQPTDTPWGVPQ
jgi:prepilin-type processing-associated H-X9-DG protein/prepilin-type N-terminal cleavage/methylation domain-containing protein